MPVVGLALLLIGYSFLYSGASNLSQGDKGWGFLESLLGPTFNGKGFGNTKLASFGNGSTGSNPGGSPAKTTKPTNNASDPQNAGTLPPGTVSV